jgi:hydroxyacylglutathione hydrolase
MSRSFAAALLVSALACAGPARAQNPFPTWIDGGNCAVEPRMQIFQYDPDTFVLRQSMCTNYEGPFLYLLFGEDKVLMEDSGAFASPALPIKRYVGRVIQSWLVAHGRTSIELVVAHSHAHGDHTAYDAALSTLPNTTVVGTSASAVQAFFGITSWPTQTVAYDLGGRIVDVIPIPGHQAAHIALYDRDTRLLLTGDTLYPGRLYINDFAAYRASVQRLVDFTATREVAWVLGTHVEMQNVPGQQFPLGSTFHPNEHPLQLSRSHLLELLGGLNGMQASPHVEVHADFVIYPL